MMVLPGDREDNTTLATCKCVAKGRSMCNRACLGRFVSSESNALAHVVTATSQYALHSLRIANCTEQYNCSVWLCTLHALVHDVNVISVIHKSDGLYCGTRIIGTRIFFSAVLYRTFILQLLIYTRTSGDISSGPAYYWTKLTRPQRGACLFAY